MRRRTFVLAGLATLVGAPAAQAQSGPAPMSPVGPVEMWRTPGCGCCGLWAEHLEANGFSVTIHEGAAGELARVKQQAGIPHELAACHTAKVGGYAVEGHVPADEVTRLLRERPDAIGLAVPGMPIGSPGMEVGDRTEPYDVLLVKRDGTTEVFAKY